jgi:dTDP-6-deoxy-L-talose 4-dehydrogenase (NAD+)
VAIARRDVSVDHVSWRNAVDFVPCDLHDPTTDPAAAIGTSDVLMHLAWPGLPNYNELFHFERNLPADYGFIKRMIEAGTKHVLVSGTCLEYGQQCGELLEDTPALPTNPYGLAKNTLRLFLQALQAKHPFVLQWARLFYLHGPCQSPNSLLAQLDRAIDAGASTFNMSGGDQLRDYLPVEVAARDLVALAEHGEFSGIVNCCSGKPISIHRLVEERIKERGSQIALNRGFFPYPDYEPFAFWGSRKKLDRVIGGGG